MGKIRKALLAAAGAALTGLITATVQKGALPGWAEISTAIGVGIATGLGVWRIENKRTQITVTQVTPPQGR